jgi:hypothetical protein
MIIETAKEILLILCLLSMVGQASGQDAALPASASAKASPFAKATADKSADRQAGVPGAGPNGAWRTAPVILRGDESRFQRSGKTLPTNPGRCPGWYE